LEQRLHAQRPAGWQSKGWRERTVVTRFGDVRVRRRLYQDAQGGYHFLLDEQLGWEKAQVATPSLQAHVVTLASRLPFRAVSATVAGLTAGVLAAATVHRLLSRVAHQALTAERRAWQGCLVHGAELPTEGRRLDTLYVEADGVWVHLQREAERWYEVKSASAYEGWRRLPQQAERYALVGKRLYGHGDETLPFWEAASLEWSRRWDLSRVRQVVINGDGAAWIDEGVEWFPGAVRQRDGFHLARWCARAVGWEAGQRVYQQIRAGQPAAALALLAQAPPRPGAQAGKALATLRRQAASGADWRRQVAAVPLEARGLGTMESQEDKLVANRMKKRGMSWTIAGAQRMAKVIQLAANNEVSRWCGRPPPEWGKERLCTVAAGNHRGAPGAQEWLSVGVPALIGPHASRPWVQMLRQLVHVPSPLT
jgi:hypothetical protein